MNNDRRKAIETARDYINRAKEILEMARDEEQEYFDNMPSSFQDADKGQAAQNAAEKLGECFYACEQIDSDIGEALGE